MDEPLELRAETDLPPFDGRRGPNRLINIKAANARNLIYDPERKVYADLDGNPKRDKYGRPLKYN